MMHNIGSGVHIVCCYCSNHTVTIKMHPHCASCAHCTLSKLCCPASNLAKDTAHQYQTSCTVSCLSMHDTLIGHQCHVCLLDQQICANMAGHRRKDCMATRSCFNMRSGPPSWTCMNAARMECAADPQSGYKQAVL